MNSRSDCHDSMLMTRFALERAARAGLDPDRIARLAGAPSWREGGERTRVAARYCLRVWELVEQETGDPDVALRVSAESATGEFGLLEYLFLSAETLGAALDQCVRHSGSLSTCYTLRIADRSETAISYQVLAAVDDCRGRELLIQAIFALLVGRARAATRSPVVPLRVGLRQAAPARRDAFVELFGTRAIDFGSAEDTVTLRASDLALPMKSADPELTAVLVAYAATLPATPEFGATWLDRLGEVLDAALEDGTATLEPVARRLLTSPRSLQRRLSEAGTTWRREVDRARRRRLQRAEHLPRAQQAKFLGYADPASLRRAVGRWREREDS
ncbi:AraC family transcriptional regulator ligand-binding domain-containing protein [Nocardia seriolae]|uniref:AraC family transcriptional regulator ligand-binding domain-containing protein n=1 Tax=Nocardia seriolae TaxID=37332 RepID=UPI00068DEEB6|nr:AraC family transcriptional regulator ligand-binding domain-containing protein [Nocardia seriolae]MTJ61755.1 AraC family transcriptional regulator [Nocardia seriolae]MTJ76244.1 AraC family transcriptional regulator [Nocardia seriolae]MTJ86759.1 AraC family transcriptional regulator [Nocardia seriolae]MTK30754.1 AraC family transcriptional regulator [Nocardia seriolae]MTK39726.1 AraC family transcriptional regulator [Nocardia seriolae]